MALGSGSGLTVGELTAFLTVDDKQFNRGIDDGQSKFASFAKGLAGVAAAGVAAAGAAMTGLAVSGLKEFGKFERGMNEVFTLLPDVTQDAMGQMERDVRDFALEMGTTTDEVVPSLYQALSAGVPQDNVFEFLETANQAAIGGVTDLETAVDGISSVVNAYGEDIIGAGEASDLMFTAVRLGKTTFEELSSSLSNVIPIAAANGVEFDNITAALASMTSQGIPTAQATTQLRQAIVELSDSGTAVGEAFEAVANTSFRDFMASGGDMAEVMAILEEAADANGVSIDQLFGSVEAGSAALALSGENLDGFRGNIDDMGLSADAAMAAYETMDQGIDRALERIGVAWDEVKLIIGEQLAPVLQDLADWVLENMPAIQEKFGELTEKAVEMGKGLRDWWTETAKPAIDEFLRVIRENWPSIEGIFESLGEVATNVGEILANIFGGMADDADESSSDIESSVGGIITVLEALADTSVEVSERFANRTDLIAAAAEGDMERGKAALWDYNSDLYIWLAEMALGWATFTHNVEAAVDDAVQALREMPGRMIASVTVQMWRFAQLGRDMIDGVKDGIQQRAAGLAAGAVVAVVDALNAAKRAVGARSPAKAFIDLGHDMGEGLIVGQRDMMADVVREAEAIAKAAVPDLGRSAMAGVGTGALAGAVGGLGGGEHDPRGQLFGDVYVQDPVDVDTMMRRAEFAARSGGL